MTNIGVDLGKSSDVVNQWFLRVAKVDNFWPTVMLIKIQQFATNNDANGRFLIAAKIDNSQTTIVKGKEQSTLVQV